MREAQNTGCIQGTTVERSDAPSDADNISRPGETFTVPGAWEVSAQVHSLAVVKICVCFQGIQFFTDVSDDDDPPGSSVSDQLVDNFSIDLNTTFLIPGAIFTERTVHNGSFGFGQFELSLRVSCAANFFGPNCATDCVPQCDLNGECMDDINTFTCECNAGFTGADCMTDINGCEVVDCGNGVSGHWSQLVHL